MVNFISLQSKFRDDWRYCTPQAGNFKGKKISYFIGVSLTKFFFLSQLSAYARSDAVAERNTPFETGLASLGRSKVSTTIKLLCTGRIRRQSRDVGTAKLKLIDYPYGNVSMYANNPSYQ